MTTPSGPPVGHRVAQRNVCGLALEKMNANRRLQRRGTSTTGSQFHCKMEHGVFHRTTKLLSTRRQNTVAVFFTVNGRAKLLLPEQNHQVAHYSNEKTHDDTTRQVAISYPDAW